MSADRLTFADFLRNLRKSDGFTLREVSRRAKISASYLSDIELGRRLPSIEVAQRLASVLRYPSLGMHELLKAEKVASMEAELAKLRQSAPARTAPKGNRSKR